MPPAMADLRHPYLLPFPSSLDSTLPAPSIWKTLSSLWDALLPFAILWWNFMLSATCAKYYSWRRMIHPSSSHGLCFSISCRSIANSHRSPSVIASPSLPLSDGYIHDDDEEEPQQQHQHQQHGSSGLELFDHCYHHRLDGSVSDLAVSEVKPFSTKRKHVDENEDAEPWRTCSDAITSQTTSAILNTGQKLRPSVQLNAVGFSVKSKSHSIRPDMLSSLCVSSSKRNSSYITSTELSDLPSIASCTKLSHLSLQHTMAVPRLHVSCEDCIHPNLTPLQELRLQTERSRSFFQYNNTRPTTVGFNLSPDLSKLLCGFCFEREPGQVIETFSGQALTWAHTKNFPCQLAKLNMQIRPLSMDEEKPRLTILKPIVFNCTSLASSPVVNPRHGQNLRLEVDIPHRKIVHDLDILRDEDEESPTKITCFDYGHLKSLSFSEVGSVTTVKEEEEEEEDGNNILNGDHLNIEYNGLYVAFNEFYTAYVGGDISNNMSNSKVVDNGGHSSHNSQDDEYIVEDDAFYGDEAQHDKTDDDNDVSFQGSHPLHYSPLSDNFTDEANHEEFSSSTWFDEGAIFIVGGESEEGNETVDQTWLIV